MVDNYFKFERNVTGKSKTRFDLTQFSEPIYDPLNKDYFYLINTPEKIKAHSKRKTDFGLFHKEWITSLYIPDISKPNCSYGDIKNTEDLLLINIIDNVLEILVCKGKKNFFQSVMNLYFDGELNEEIKKIRFRALIKNNSNNRAG